MKCIYFHFKYILNFLFLVGIMGLRALPPLLRTTRMLMLEVDLLCDSTSTPTKPGAYFRTAVMSSNSWLDRMPSSLIISSTSTCVESEETLCRCTQLLSTISFPTSCKCQRQIQYTFSGRGQTPTTTEGTGVMVRQAMKVKAKAVSWGSSEIWWYYMWI